MDMRIYVQASQFDPGGGGETHGAELLPAKPSLNQLTPSQCKDSREIINNSSFKPVNFGVVCNIVVSN